MFVVNLLIECGDGQKVVATLVLDSTNDWLISGVKGRVITCVSTSATRWVIAMTIGRSVCRVSSIGTITTVIVTTIVLGKTLLLDQ